MKKIIMLAVTVAALSSCYRGVSGSGKIISEKRTVTNFTGISAATSIDVEVRMGNTYEVTVEADDNVQKLVVTSVENGVLKVSMADNSSVNNADIKVLVTAPTLNKLKASSSASIVCKDVIKNDGNIDVEASSSADIDANLDAPSVHADANSSASITLTGRTKNFKAESSSSATIKSSTLLTENAEVDANSSGDAYVHASITLNAKASSSGTIKYKGNPAVTQSVNSSGSVEKE